MNANIQKFVYTILASPEWAALGLQTTTSDSPVTDARKLPYAEVTILGGQATARNASLERSVMNAAVILDMYVKKPQGQLELAILSDKVSDVLGQRRSVDGRSRTSACSYFYVGVDPADPSLVRGTIRCSVQHHGTVAHALSTNEIL